MCLSVPLWFSGRISLALNTQISTFNIMAEKSPRQPRKPFQNKGNRKPFKKSSAGSRQPAASTRRSADEQRNTRFAGRPAKDRDERETPARSGKARSFKSKEDGDAPSRKVARKKFGDKGSERFTRDSQRSELPKRRTASDERRAQAGGPKKFRKDKYEEGSRPVRPLSSKKYPSRRGVKFKPNAEKEGIRLNKYIANAGICSRREADQLIIAGVIKVNGEVITALGTKVMPGDKVVYGDQAISNEKKRYLLLNKQKGYVTTTKDPHAKNTVMELIEGACKERIYPVGRLDRNTTGLLLFTNDGELAKKLMHPSSRIKKMYHVVLDQPLKKNDLLKVADGINLNDEKVLVDSIAYVEDAKDRREVGMELHSGQNRVVRKIFESLGYKVTKLDRVVYAGLTKKGIPRGKWRFLDEKEVIRLKMLR